MRKPLAASLLLLLLTSLASAVDPLHLVHYGGDLGRRDGMASQVKVYADLGGALVARIDTATLARLRTAGTRTVAIPEPRTGEILMAVYRMAPSSLPAGVRVAVADRDHLLVLGQAAAVRGLWRPGIYNGGIEAIDLAAPLVATRPMALPATDGPADPRIAALVAKVQKANLIAHIKALSSLFSRHVRRSENKQAVTYLANELRKLPGVTVTTPSFSTYYGTVQNVVGEIKGLEKPDEIVMTGAHLDSATRYSTQAAPGADDNASGCAAVLEMARILSAAPLQKTVRFGFWNAEEIGLYGSKDYASKASQRGDKIIGYLNTDMNAYRAPGDTVDVDFINNYSSSTLITYLSGISRTYVPTLGVKQGNFSAGTSDHRSFTQYGFPAVFYFEDLDKYSPYIHTTQDDMVNSTNDMDLSRLITQSVLAGMASLALPLDPPQPVLGTLTGPTVGGTTVQVTGTGLASVTGIKVGGTPVPFTPANGAITFVTPRSAVAGQVKVDLTNPAGSGSAYFTYALTSPAALRLPSPLAPGAGASGAVGATPGHHAVTLASPLLGPTPMGLIGLDIGGGNPVTLIFFHQGPLSPGGGTLALPLQVPKDPALVGAKVHFQACTIDPTTLALGKTNAATLAIR